MVKPDFTVVVAGAGQAGAQTASTLRQQGFTGRIVLVGDERSLPTTNSRHPVGLIPEVRVAGRLAYQPPPLPTPK